MIKSEKGNLIFVIKNDFDNANKLMGKDKDTNEDL
ncbi:hypothetical protein BOM_1281 (plasmid) [Borrelia miyamotoi FR64b]|uniref:Uncharacterized protein n=1 Tax=Borrelia miyamotoi FR64b TaxID=1292392 RepID=W5SFE8_9SPIR|nr:hypothetical protein BOM_1281 [Borrelia miyamotoi FR64b]